MSNTAFNRIIAALVCALLGDIPVAIVRVYVDHLDQVGTIGWILISTGLFAVYLRFFERGNPSVTPTDAGPGQ